MDLFAKLAVTVLFLTAMPVLTQPWSDAVNARHERQGEESYEAEYGFACKVGNAPSHCLTARKTSQQ